MDKTFTQKKISFNSTKSHETIENMNPLLLQPEEHIINRLLNYSKSLKVEQSKMVSRVEMVLN